MPPRSGGGLTEHERVGEERGEGDEQAAEAAADVGELGGLAAAGEGGVVCVPVEGMRGWRIAERVVGEGIGVRALAVVSFLAGRGG